MSEADIKSEYGEAVRLYLWYTGSTFSAHQGKASKDLAATYKKVFERLHAERLKLLRASLDGS